MAYLNRLKTSKFINGDLFPFFVLGLAMFMFHLLIPIPILDDIDFSFAGTMKLDLSALVIRYNTWTSRILPEYLIIQLLKAPSILWRLLNTLIYTSLGVAISHLLVHKQKRMTNWFIAILLLIYPLREIANAGWVTTTVIYLWPLTFALVVLNLLRKIIQQEDFKFPEVLLSILLLLFAINLETICILLTLLFLAAAIHLLRQKRLHWFAVVGLLMCITSLVFIFASPGNAARYAIELEKFPDFSHISLITKLEMGMSSTFAFYFFNFNLVFIVFSLLLFLVVKNHYTHWFYRVYTFLPLLVVILFGLIPSLQTWLSGFMGSDQPIKALNIPILGLPQASMTRYGLITLVNFTMLRTYLTLILLYAAACMVVISVVMAFSHNKRSFLALGILALGFASRMAMAFLPTIWVSNTRTFLLLTTAIILCSVMLFQDLLEQQAVEKTRIFLLYSGFLAGLSYVHLILNV